MERVNLGAVHGAEPAVQKTHNSHEKLSGKETRGSDLSF